MGGRNHVKGLHSFHTTHRLEISAPICVLDMMKFVFEDLDCPPALTCITEFLVADLGSIGVLAH